MRPEDLVQEPVADEHDVVNPHKPHGNTIEAQQTQEYHGWLSHLLPHMSIPFPSVPALSARLPCTRSRASSGLSEDANADNGEKRRVRKQVKGYHKFRRQSQPSVNRLELSPTNSSYPEDVHVRRAPN